MSKTKESLNLYFISILTGILVFILYLHFEDNFMRNNCILKLMISLIFIIITISVICILVTNPDTNNHCNCLSEHDYSFLLVHENKNETVCSRSNDLNELLLKCELGDLLYFFSDDFSITSDQLCLKINDQKTKKIKLKYNSDDSFLIIIENN